MSKHILFPTAQNRYKANMHTHTTWSDGKLTPEEVRDLYRNAGYQIVAFSDHEVCLSHKDLALEDFLPITAYELAVNPSACRDRDVHDKCYHMSLFSRDPDNTRHICFDRGYVRDRWPVSKLEVQAHNLENRTYSTDYVNHLIETAREQGWLVSLNHPTWSMQDREDYIGVKGLWGVEVFNSGCTVSGYVEEDERVYDEMIRAGIPVYPLAADDMHKVADAFGGWLTVSADRLDTDAVFAAFDHGDFYASNGPEFGSITVEDGILKVTCSPCRTIRVNTECRCSFRADGENGTPLTEAEFDLEKWLKLCPEGGEDRAFIRVTAIDEAGKKAWSRAYFREEVKEFF